MSMSWICWVGTFFLTGRTHGKPPMIHHHLEEYLDGTFSRHLFSNSKLGDLVVSTSSRVVHFKSCYQGCKKDSAMRCAHKKTTKIGFAIFRPSAPPEAFKCWAFVNHGRHAWPNWQSAQSAPRKTLPFEVRIFSEAKKGWHGVTSSNSARWPWGSSSFRCSQRGGAIV